MVVQDLSRFKRRPFRFKRNLHRMVGSRSLKVRSWFASSDLNVVSLGVSRFEFAFISLQGKLHLGSPKVHEFSNSFHPRNSILIPRSPKMNYYNVYGFYMQYNNQNNSENMKSTTQFTTFGNLSQLSNPNSRTTNSIQFSNIIYTINWKLASPLPEFRWKKIYSNQAPSSSSLCLF